MAAATEGTPRADRDRSRRRARRGAVGVLALVALLGASCGDDDAGTADPAAPATTAAGEGTTTAPELDEGCTAERVGGEVTMSVFSETRSLDPTITTGTGTTGGTELSALYDTLLRFDYDTSTFEPWLAESIEPNADFTEWTLTLRPGLTFGNGDPLDAEATRASIARHVAPESRSVVKPEVAQIAQMDVVDDLTLKFTLAEPWGTFPYVLADMAGMIVNTKVVAERGQDFSIDAKGAGAGPYELVHFIPGEEMLFEARDDWWGGPVCIQELRFIDLIGEPTTYESMKAGEIDLMYFREPATAPQAREDGFDITSEIVWLGQGVLINHAVNDPITADVRIRQAVAHALDPEVLSERGFDGNLITTTALAPDTSPYHVDVPGPEPDVDKAKALVDEVKAEGWDGSIRLACPDTTEQVGITIETMLNAAGFTTKREIMPIGDFSKKVYVDRDYELACGGAGPSDSSPWVRLSRFYGASNYFTSYQNADFDAALRDLKLATSPEEAHPAMEELQRIWNETIPSVGLGALEAGIITREGLHGVLPNVNMMVTFAKAYVEE